MIIWPEIGLFYEEFMVIGISLDESKNELTKKVREHSEIDRARKILIIPTMEEWKSQGSVWIAGLISWEWTKAPHESKNARNSGFITKPIF